MKPTTFLVLALLVLLLALLSLGIGAGRVGVPESLRWLLQGLHSDDAQTQMVLAELRLPRVLKAMSIGAALGAAGVLLQSITRNPLADSGLLGVNSGAALAVATGLAWQQALSPFAQIVWALGGALAGSALVAGLASARGRAVSPLRLVLSGLALAATCQSLTALSTLGRQANLDQYRFWVLGSLTHPHAGLLLPGLMLIGAGLLAAASLARPLSALGLGDELSQALGHRPVRARIAAVAAVAVLSGTAVAMAGPIAFLGLIAPYLARAWAGTGVGVGVGVGGQLAGSILVGASLLLLADLAARLVVQPFEAPVTALLALLGAPLLIWMVRRDALLSLTGMGGER